MSEPASKMSSVTIFRIVLLATAIIAYHWLLVAISRKGRKWLWISAGSIALTSLVIQFLGPLGGIALLGSSAGGPKWVFVPMSIGASAIVVATALSISPTLPRRIMVPIGIMLGLVVVLLFGVSIWWL